MKELIEKLFDIGKVPTKIIFTICICCGIILFVPANFLAKLNLTEFLHDYSKYIGITFITTSALLVVTFINFLYHYFSRMRTEARLSKKIRSSIKKEIAQLNIHEQAVLREFFIQDKHTLNMPFTNDTVISLENKRIIYRTANIGPVYRGGPMFPYSIEDFARVLLTSELLGFPENPTEENRRKIFEARPYWAKEQQSLEQRRNSAWF
ncbi:hypothetical protein J2T02_002643 [Chitinophaga terrae (ex Kim and Jung 2007)]|uniref:superinfection exclusion B family protein n=1 Tax=Chitinophaga terrae (ex Kim and Jung 2007) TaxID=408074 RepID=UPI0027844ED5|nr:superinfection exclusion B family protein [Chitinophaga terrae (ex Kim and Jung 2007)]MDQ0107524.1 hypothetical protein [Chitinophaga terrae (ex Kim and Jung 2007)]